MTRRSSTRPLTCRVCGATPAERRDPVSEHARGYVCCRCLMPRKPGEVSADYQTEEHRLRIKQVAVPSATDGGSDGSDAAPVISNGSQGGSSRRRRIAAPGALKALPRARAVRAAKRRVRQAEVRHVAV